MNISAVASWHTNSHEYAARRLSSSLLKWLPAGSKQRIESIVERVSFSGLMWLHFLAQVQLAPNRELVEEIQRRTRRPSFLMERGVDIDFFHPAKRDEDGGPFSIGYVGRLRPEKNVRFFQEIERALKEAGITNYQLVFVGEGSEDKWLRENVPGARLHGVLRGDALARAYANMDVFVFPSKTDAFGNVVLEAMASGVPAVVMPDGGPRYLIDDGKNGFIADCDADFVKTVLRLAEMPGELLSLKVAARAAACQRSWHDVFERLYESYRFATTVRKNVRA